MLLLAKNSTLPKLIRNGRLFLGGALLGVLVFVLVFGVSTLDVTNDAFCRGGYIEKDIQQHYAGWLFYRQSSAGWPLCIARGINYPDGLSVAYTDSIPLVAALLKPVANLVGGTFQYMGWFTLVCFALQGGFGALLAGLFLPGARHRLLRTCCLLPVRFCLSVCSGIPRWGHSFLCWLHSIFILLHGAKGSMPPAGCLC